MIISHKYRYIFIQTMKTASTAIARELCENYSGEHILAKHSTISEFREQASEVECSYFSFAGVRNPLDVLVSRFVLRRDGRNTDDDHREQHRFIQEHGGDFNAYVSEYLVRRQRLELGMVPNDWNSESFASIDYIYHYETLQDGFAKILTQLDIPQIRELPFVNRTASKENYLAYYNESSLQMASRLFANYMRRFGYDQPAHDTPLN